jgi:hypothetical protein
VVFLVLGVVPSEREVREMQLLIHQLDRETLTECLCGWTMPVTDNKLDEWRRHIAADGSTERLIVRDEMPAEIALVVKAFHGELATCHGEESVR